MSEVNADCCYQELEHTVLNIPTPIDVLPVFVRHFLSRPAACWLYLYILHFWRSVMVSLINCRALHVYIMPIVSECSSLYQLIVYVVIFSNRFMLDSHSICSIYLDTFSSLCRFYGIIISMHLFVFCFCCFVFRSLSVLILPSSVLILKINDK